MELSGMPPESMIDKSRKKDHYFDTDYSPFLIEDEELGILRIPSSRNLSDAIPCEDNLFLDFLLVISFFEPFEVLEMVVFLKIDDILARTA